MNRPLKIAIGLVIASAAAAVLIFAFIEGRAEMARERERQKPIHVPSRVTLAQDGSVELHFDKEAQQRSALRIEPLAAAQLAGEVEGYGQIAADPLDSFTVRSPFSGRLRAAQGFEWPGLGRRLESGTTLGEIEPRLGPVEQLDLSLRRSSIEKELAALRAELDTARASLEASSASHTRLAKLNEQEKNASDRALQEARATLHADEARVRGAQASIEALESSLRSSAAPILPIPVSLEVGGAVVEVLAHPGETVEAGQEILVVSRLEHWLATVSLPLGTTFDEAFTRARVRVESLSGQFFEAERVGEAPEVDPRTRGRTLLLSLRGGDAALRAGAAVVAFLPAGGTPSSGVTLPRDAVVRYGGRAWVYVRVREDVFVRREVTLDRATDAGWFIRRGLQAGELAVVAGAQTLLSEELKSQIRIGEGEEGG